MLFCILKSEPLAKKSYGCSVFTIFPHATLVYHGTFACFSPSHTHSKTSGNQIVERQFLAYRQVFSDL